MKKIIIIVTILLCSSVLFAQDGTISKLAKETVARAKESKRQEILHCKGLSKDSVVHIYDRFVKMLLDNKDNNKKKITYTNLEYIVSNIYQGELRENIGDKQNLILLLNEAVSEISTKSEIADVAESYQQANDFYSKISNNSENEKYILSEGSIMEGYYFWKGKFDLARISFKQNKFKDACVNYSIAAQYYLPDSSYYLAAMALIKENETVKSAENNNLILKSFSKAIQINPANKIYLGDRGKFYLQKVKDTVNGLADLNRAAQLKSADPEIYYQLALYNYSKLHNLQEAIRNFTACISLKPEKADYYYLRAILYRDSKNYNEALQDFKSAIKYGKANPDYYAGRGYCNSQLNNFIDAYDDYNVALLLNPKDEVSRANVQKLDPILKDEYSKKGVTAQNAFQYFMKQGDDYLKNDDRLYAALSYTKCTKIQPTNTEPYNKAGKIFGIYKLNSFAEPYLRYAAYSNGKSSEYFVDLGKFYITNLEAYQKGSGILDTAALLGSKNEIGYYLNGLCKHYALANSSGALKDYTAAIQLSPNFKDALLKRGDLLMIDLKNYPAALSDYEALNKLDPNNEIYLFKIKTCNEKMKN